MKDMLAPSMMCCDFLHMASEIEVFEQEKIELLHLDVMDGHFVPNLALGTDFVRQLKKATAIPLDLHLMVENPEAQLAAFPVGEGDVVSVHFEATRHLQRTLGLIKSTGARALLALNPATPVELAVDVLDDIDGLLLMTVNPGFAGQRMVPHGIAKIARARAFLDGQGRGDAVIEVDGNVSVENAKRMRAAGADIFVLGTSALFGKGPLAESIRYFRKEVFV